MLPTGELLSLIMHCSTSHGPLRQSPSLVLRLPQLMEVFIMRLTFYILILLRLKCLNFPSVCQYFVRSGSSFLWTA